MNGAVGLKGIDVVEAEAGGCLCSRFYNARLFIDHGEHRAQLGVPPVIGNERFAR